MEYVCGQDHVWWVGCKQKLCSMVVFFLHTRDLVGRIKNKLISSGLECFNSLHARCTVYPGLSLKDLWVLLGTRELHETPDQIGEKGRGLRFLVRSDWSLWCLGKEPSSCPHPSPSPTLYVLKTLGITRMLLVDQLICRTTNDLTSCA